ncbi:phosphatidyl synthase [Coprinopsis cinerea okayama7|uniref:Phosphatidyl synthase n=1 Tax=Coprinopsis cinerea (strain Okayama-7 / 130 / ATCC MYA-4618 / FGSC 9003) TaxID=240176 RepID=D6RNP4_COPC7|nr:phosphatidyl synthase [Coprinopsis cinerea okayama7\|eukprot:XP_002910837.1 phosphatidyl synthase [Coprinopsis cinerea okayama7\
MLVASVCRRTPPLARVLCQRQQLNSILSSATTTTRASFTTGAPKWRSSIVLLVEKRWLSTTAVRRRLEREEDKQKQSTGTPANSSTPTEPEPETSKPSIRENIYTIPNILTVSRIISCPILGWSILEGNYQVATGLLVYAGLTDLVDGFLARKYNMSSVLGTVLDPAADKMLMTTLVVTLTMQDMLPLPLAVIILGRDVILSLWAFWIRYQTLPYPKTWSRYWDFGLPSAEVKPTTVSKVNTALQLLLMGTTTISPLLPFSIGLGLQGLQWTVATTTIWSGSQYLLGSGGFKVVAKR